MTCYSFFSGHDFGVILGVFVTEGGHRTVLVRVLLAKN